ncbi:hypothetical protein OEZ85_001778 [Tetradesmus obliquus]|uniref:Uncharacterized protein n=1 Tax=Tetradesmus obliquus TaxID=3088 RepID=A0ABY8U3P2_TETOB|nr:hypothetical protein OEZ85_001777 [Tetradesmus obliquus]WIA15081.1 hypothetical protein OEZ85_001778 [Tetradesmus obliquus]
MHRPLAAEAYVAKKGDIPTATAEFLTRCQNLEIKAPRDAASFVERWGQRWVEDGSIEGHGSNSGRKRMLSSDDGQLVVGYLKKGRADADGGVYGSIRELRQECPEVDEMLQARGASDSTVERAVHYECPEMVYGDLVVKPKYTCKQLNDRYSTAAGHLETFTTSFRVGQRVIWIDAKTMPMHVNSKKGWFIPSEKDTFETTLPTNLKQPLVLKYYIAVNYLLGALELVFYTGTTGMPADRNPGAPYKTKKGKKARGVTSMEVNDIMKLFKEKAEEPGNMAHLRRGEHWLYSWDNDKIHKGADMSKMGIKPEHRFDLPELSSDMHKTVEHVHGWLDHHMQLWLQKQNRKELTIDACKQQLQHLFYNVLKKESIQRDVESLVETYEAIVLAGGGHVTSQFR